MNNDEQELSRRIIAALGKHQRTKLADKNRLIFSVIVGFAITAFLGFYAWESQPRVRITNLNVYHNVRRSSGQNMRIVIDFKTAHLKNRHCTAITYFYHQNGQKVRSTIRGYQTRDNQLSTSATFRPTYQYSVYTNFNLYIPNRYFNRGNYKGKVRTYCGSDFLGNTKNFQFRVN
ncbi:hypothetical protein NIES46_38230 [Arthrospira platensis NIES-46]|jgi:hypothetical protein|uniref:Uncharacterized protein n=1 Tax=Limnospira platensis NIES-46 TaxID=1236695 RepID=A0A5M3TA50_LIMPL|nr:hypothetical protein [Arthrospira platensis]GCE95757.1 hypothetical protein NIES46_38230 [Arthrospira platensis NIES-46]